MVERGSCVPWSIFSGTLLNGLCNRDLWHHIPTQAHRCHVLVYVPVTRLFFYHKVQNDVVCKPNCALLGQLVHNSRSLIFFFAYFVDGKPPFLWSVIIEM